jgi:REP element-mobilizing transposase RayT
MDRPITTSFRRRNLPHWRVAGRPYFVTFRLKGSLPAAVIEELHAEYGRLVSKAEDDRELAETQWQQFLRLEAALDRAIEGPTHLGDARIAQLVMDGFLWLDKRRHWQIPAAVVMPNHVHCLMVAGDATREAPEKSLGIMKGFVARQANRILGCTGKPFWTPENFDHWCRHPGKTEGVIEYIHQNPVNAGLVRHWQDWPWMK